MSGARREQSALADLDKSLRQTVGRLDHRPIVETEVLSKGLQRLQLVELLDTDTTNLAVVIDMQVRQKVDILGGATRQVEHRFTCVVDADESGQACEGNALQFAQNVVKCDFDAIFGRGTRLGDGGLNFNILQQSLALRLGGRGAVACPDCSLGCVQVQ